jgi:hypothetical protein
MMHSTLFRAATPVVLAAAALSAAPAQAAVVYSVVGTTEGGATFNRPLAGNPPTGLSGVGTAVAYNTFSFSPAQSGSYSFLLTSTTANFDPFLALYSGTFNPASPLTNLVVANDDFTTGNSTLSGFTYALLASSNYTAVITGFNNADFGTYALTISTAAEAAIPEPATWALMLVGFGAVGASARYRRRGTAVRFG